MSRSTFFSRGTALERSTRIGWRWVTAGAIALGIWIGEEVVVATVTEHLPWTKWIMPFLAVLYGVVTLAAAQWGQLRDIRHRPVLRWAGLAGILLGESLCWLQSARPAGTLVAVGLLAGMLAAWRSYRLGRVIAIEARYRPGT